jgi:FKBP-type peptidyl-prolyl cis-trans isomerase SlyD
MKVEARSEVELRYKLLDAEGHLVEETDEEPIRYTHGREEILPGLEAALEGLEAGSSLTVALEPEEAYGPYNPEGLVAIPRAELPAEHAYEVGEWVSIVVEGLETEAEEDEGDEMEMRIVEVREGEIVLDANHPLAGQSVTFEVEILSVGPPSA